MYGWIRYLNRSWCMNHNVWCMIMWLLWNKYYMLHTPVSTWMIHSNLYKVWLIWILQEGAKKRWWWSKKFFGCFSLFYLIIAFIFTNYSLEYLIFYIFVYYGFISFSLLNLILKLKHSLVKVKKIVFVFFSPFHFY